MSSLSPGSRHWTHSNLDARTRSMVEPSSVGADAADTGGVPLTVDASGDQDGAPVLKTSRVLSETAWVARAQDGDATAFTHLVRAYEGELFRLGYRILSDRGEAQDVVQDVLVIMWRRLPSLSDPQAFRSWIYQIATRRCLQVLRRNQRQRTDVVQGEDFEQETRSHVQPAPAKENPSAVAQATAVRRGLDQALADLPPDQRACWVLYQLHDLTYTQIAYAIGAPVSTVRGRISRARQNLAKGMRAWQ